MKKLISAALLLTSVAVQAQVYREKPLIQIFDNKNCEGVLCNLTEFKLHSYNFKVVFPDGDSFGSKAFMSYKTKEVSQLEDFAIVQFIKGCVFESNKKVDGTIERVHAVSREFFGNIVRFNHPEWVIDSVDLDPMYNNAPQGNRHGAHRWNKVPNSYSKETQEYYGRVLPVKPELYVSDTPATAFFMNGTARNISFKFRTCIYETKNIPTQVSAPNDLDFSTPLKCFDWASSSIYNHEINKYESKDTIDPFCS